MHDVQRRATAAPYFQASVLQATAVKCDAPQLLKDDLSLWSLGLLKTSAHDSWGYLSPSPLPSTHRQLSDVTLSKLWKVCKEFYKRLYRWMLRKVFVEIRGCVSEKLIWICRLCVDYTCSMPRAMWSYSDFNTVECGQEDNVRNIVHKNAPLKPFK